MRSYANNDGGMYAEQIIPGMYHDVLGRILHRDPKFSRSGDYSRGGEKALRFGYDASLFDSYLMHVFAAPGWSP